MTTDILQLDENYNALIQEMKISHNSEDTIYKNSSRYKHSDIVFIPSFVSIQKIIMNLPTLPKRYNDIKGTERFKTLKDYILTFNLLQQYFSPHSVDKKLIALDNRYIEKSLTSRYRNNKNKFFDNYFKLEIKGVKGQYTSGFSLTDEAVKEIGSYSIVIHKDKLDSNIIKFLNGDFNDTETIIKKEELLELTNDSYIEIPNRNIEIVKTFNNIYSQRIVSNYKDGKLYYSKNIKDYGRTYSYLHNIPREIRNELFVGFTEIDLESAAQAILYRLVYNKINNLSYLEEYISNKTSVRNRISKDLDYSLGEVKRLIQVVTFSNGIPSKAQLPLKPSYKGIEKGIEHDFIKGLSKDLSKVDEILKLDLLDFEKEILIKRNGSLKNIDIRCYKFQSIESKLMAKIQSLLLKNSFHLHDAVYVKNISEEEIFKIEKYLKKFQINTSYTILDSKKYIEEFKNSSIKIKSEDKLLEYINFCINNDKSKKVLDKNGYSRSSHHHILPVALFEEYSNLKENQWNGTHLLYSDHYYAHWLLTEAIEDYGMLSAFYAMHNKDIKNGRINEEDLIPAEEFQRKMEERKYLKRKWDNEIIVNDKGEISTNINEVAKKISKTKKSKEWKETIGNSSKKKELETKTSEKWLNEVGYEQYRKHKDLLNSENWKETKGKIRSAKHSKTKNSKEWKETIGKTQREKISSTMLSKEWKESIGVETKNKRHKTITSDEWQKTIGVERKRKEKETKNSKEWKETIGIEAKKKTKLTKLRRGKWYFLFTQNGKELISAAELKELNSALSKSTESKPLGSSTQSKVILNKTRKLHMIGWYVKLTKPNEEEIIDYFNNLSII